MRVSDIEMESLTPLHWIGVALAVVTGTIHLGLGIMFFPGILPVSFLLAGLGFFSGVVLFLRNYHRRLLYLVGIPYTALLIVLYLLINYQNTSTVTPLEAVDKTVQVLLIVILAVLYRREE